MTRRRDAIESLLAQADCDHLVFCGANRFGSAVQWLTQWPVTAEAVGVFSPGERDVLFVQYVNHAPQASILADKAAVSWGGESGIAAAAETLARRGARSDRAATVGPITAAQHGGRSLTVGPLMNLHGEYARMRQVESAEEGGVLRVGACFGRLGMAAMRAALKPGLDERKLGDLVGRAYVRFGATNVVHYFG